MNNRIEKIVKYVDVNKGYKSDYIFKDKNNNKYKWNTTVKKEELKIGYWYLIRYTKVVDFQLDNKCKDITKIKSVYIFKEFGPESFETEKKISEYRLNNQLDQINKKADINKLFETIKKEENQIKELYPKQNPKFRIISSSFKEKILKNFTIEKDKVLYYWKSGSNRYKLVNPKGKSKIENINYVWEIKTN